MTPVEARPRLRVGIVKFASCDGCQLTLLGLEDELLALADRFEIVEFPEASSLRSAGPYDVLLVEGSVSTPDQAVEIQELRRQAKLLVTIGACASYGGIQALRNWSDHEAYRSAVYAHPEFVDSLATAQPIAEHVKVDAELHGCPINADQLRELLVSVAVGRRPQIREESVCLDCKRRGTVCIMVARGVPCLGPVTQSGCGALCPAFARGCYGCFGPKEQANTASLARTFQLGGRDDEAVSRLFSGFTAWSTPFRSVVGSYGGPPGQTPGQEPAAVAEAASSGTPVAHQQGADDARR
jgi:sulfhydrogenase subunit delta